MKKLIATVLSTVMVSGSFAALAVDYGEEYENHPQQQTSQSFSDVPSTHWAFDYIGEMAQREVISGYPDGRFLPENQVTRAEFAKIMVCAAGMRVSNTNQTSFTDVYTSDWYCPYIEAAKEYLTGYSTASEMVYRPTTPALREDIAVALVKLKGYDTSVVDESILNMFSDSYSISDSAKKYVAVAVERGLISGYDDNTFRGQATITRAEAATMLWRAFQYGNDNKVTDTSGTTDISQNSGSQNANNQQSTSDSQTSNKQYKIDTLANADLEYMFTYDGENIYYVSGTEIYELDPYTGDTRSIYDASDLTFQLKEMQDKEVTKTITKTVPVEKNENYEPAEEKDEPESSYSSETDEETDSTEPASEAEHEDEQPETQEITEEVTEIVQEEVVVAEFSDYMPVQIIYDEYNDRLIMDGFYTCVEEKFKLPQTGIQYSAAYDITNDEYFIKSDFNSEYGAEIKCFAAKDKAVIDFPQKWGDCNVFLYNYDTMTDLGLVVNYHPAQSYVHFWTVDNNLYFLDKGYINRYSFSGDSKQLCYTGNKIGIKGEYVYYTPSDSPSYLSEIYKINVNTGDIEKLRITSDEMRCDVTDMMPVERSNIWNIFIPISDNNIVFYDQAAKAFRRLTTND